MAEVTIRKYELEDESQLFDLIKSEGIDWSYWQGGNWDKYNKALANGISYVLFENEVLCGYARCHDDSGFGIYVYDLLVNKAYRGKEYGRLLMERICQDYPNDYIFVTSGVDTYYEKLGYEKEGSIYLLQTGESTD